MKKTLMAIALCFCAALFAESKVLVYDFQASFKRIDTKKVLTRDSNDKSISCKLDSPRVASDKFTGYLVIQACEDCYGEMENSIDQNTAVVYLVRKGDASKHIYRTVGTAEIAVFGTKSGIIREGQHAGEMMNYGKLSDCQLNLQLPFEFDMINGTGFMGPRTFTVNDLVPTKIDARGFGKIAKAKYVDNGSCMDTEYYCLAMKNNSGAFIMDYYVSGLCSDFLFDLCSAPNSGAKTHAYGTYTVKYNTAMSKGCNTFADAEALVFKKLKKAGCYGTNDDFTAEEGLYEAAKWTDVQN